MLPSTLSTIGKTFDLPFEPCLHTATTPQKNIAHEAFDILQHSLRDKPSFLLEILLKDHTTKKNIIWANDHYSEYHAQNYAATAHIKPELITGDMSHLIMPRASKSREQQKQRTKSKAEVFTPTWIVQKQNDILEQNYLHDDLESYVKRTWLEITCGEAPYMTTRYDMATGNEIALDERVGFVDRKLKRINTEIHNKQKWQQLAIAAYQASYGFEWHGDSLLLARENLLYTYLDYYVAKWHTAPSATHLKKIATIISYNVFQMDGLSYIIPLTDKPEEKPQMSFLFDEKPKKQEPRKKALTVKIKNWQSKKMEVFYTGENNHE